MKAPKPPLGYVDRGMKMPAYPTLEQIDKIEAMQPSLRAAWNWLVSRIEEPLAAAEASAQRKGLLPPKIPRPNYSGLEPEEAKARKQEYVTQCVERRQKIFDLKLPVDWRPRLTGPESEASRLGLKQDYQVVNNYLAFKGLPELPAAVVQSLVKSFQTKSTGAKRKTYRKSYDDMPIQVRAGFVIRMRKDKTSDRWTQRRCNAEVFLHGIGWIAVYLDPGLLNQLLTPGNYARLGCTLRYEHGRWSASVKIVRREVMHAGPNDGSVVGVDPGLASLAKTSDGDVLKNPRNLKYAAARELALSIADTVPHLGERKALREEVFRHDARQKRRVQTQCRQFAAMLSKKYDLIAVEANSGVALGIGSRYTGATKTLVNCIVHRVGPNRVREVESYHNSQICSQCGHHDKKTWERRLGELDQTCKCVACGYTADRDVNAARNVKNKALTLLAV